MKGTCFHTAKVVCELVLAMLCRAGSFETVDHVDDDFDGWDQCDEQEDQWIGPWLRREVGLSDSVGH